MGEVQGCLDTGLPWRCHPSFLPQKTPAIAQFFGRRKAGQSPELISSNGGQLDQSLQNSDGRDKSKHANQPCREYKHYRIKRLLRRSARRRSPDRSARRFNFHVNPTKTGMATTGVPKSVRYGLRQIPRELYAIRRIDAVVDETCCSRWKKLRLRSLPEQRECRCKGFESSISNLGVSECLTGQN